MVPDYEWTPALYRHRAEGVARKYTELSCCKQSGWEGVRNKFLLDISKFRFDKGHKCSVCPFFNESPNSRGLHLAASSVSHVEALRMIEEWKYYRRIGSGICTHQTRKFLKEMTGLWKGGASYIDPCWKLMCHWEVLGGYVETGDPTELREEAMDWLGRRKHLGGSHGVVTYTTDLYYAVCELIDQHWHLPRGLPTLKE